MCNPESPSSRKDSDPVRFTRETIEIEGGRKLYNYRFEIVDEAEPEPASPPAEGGTEPA